MSNEDLAARVETIRELLLTPVRKTIDVESVPDKEADDTAYSSAPQGDKPKGG